MATRIDIRRQPVNPHFINHVHTSISGTQLLQFIKNDLVGYLWLVLLILGLLTLFARFSYQSHEHVVALNWFIWAGFIAEVGFGGLGGIIGIGFGYSPEQIELVFNPLAIIIAIPTIWMLGRGLCRYWYHPVQPVPQRI